MWGLGCLTTSCRQMISRVVVISTFLQPYFLLKPLRSSKCFTSNWMEFSLFSLKIMNWMRISTFLLIHSNQLLILSTNGPSNMIFEHLHDCFYLEGFAIGSPKLLYIRSHTAHGHIHWHIIHVFGATCPLTIAKPFREVCPIDVVKSLYHFVNSTICFQFCNSFSTHFSFHQFSVMTKERCEIMVHAPLISILIESSYKLMWWMHLSLCYDL